MIDSIIPSAITGITALIVPSIIFFLTKKKEREAEKKSKKLVYYEEFMNALSNVVGENSSNESRLRFSISVSSLHLVASIEVIDALHQYLDEVRISNKNKSTENHNNLLSKLIFQIRTDLGDNLKLGDKEFKAILWHQ